MMNVVFYDPKTGNVVGSGSIRDTPEIEAKFLAANPNAVQVNQPITSGAQLSGAKVNPITRSLVGPALGSVATVLPPVKIK